MPNPNDHVSIPRHELEALLAERDDLVCAFLQEGNAWLADTAREFAQSRDRMDFLLMSKWYGQNHLKFQPGEHALRWTDEIDDPERVEIIQVAKYAAFVLGEEASWVPWRYLSRPERAYHQPIFDTSDWGAIANHMGFTRDTNSMSGQDLAAKELIERLSGEEQGR